MRSFCCWTLSSSEEAKKSAQNMFKKLNYIMCFNVLENICNLITQLPPTLSYYINFLICHITFNSTCFQSSPIPVHLTSFPLHSPFCRQRLSMEPSSWRPSSHSNRRTVPNALPEPRILPPTGASRDGQSIAVGKQNWQSYRWSEIRERSHHILGRRQCELAIEWYRRLRQRKKT